MSDFLDSLENNKSFQEAKEEIIRNFTKNPPASQQEENDSYNDNDDYCEDASQQEEPSLSIINASDDDSQLESPEGYESVYEDEVPIWQYRRGNAYSETQREYEILRTYLEMGRARNTVYLKRILNLTDKSISKLSSRNNWVERIEAYDRQTYLNALSEETKARELEHQRKLEFYRSQQETLANQSASGAAKMLHLINRKLNKLVQDTENLTVDEMIGVGNLSVKLVQLQKEVGAQALGVDALLDAIEDTGEN